LVLLRAAEPGEGMHSIGERPHPNEFLRQKKIDIVNFLSSRFIFYENETGVSTFSKEKVERRRRNIVQINVHNKRENIEFE